MMMFRVGCQNERINDILLKLVLEWVRVCVRKRERRDIQWPQVCVSEWVRVPAAAFLVLLQFADAFLHFALPLLMAAAQQQASRRLQTRNQLDWSGALQRPARSGPTFFVSCNSSRTEWDTSGAPTESARQSPFRVTASLQNWAGQLDWGSGFCFPTSTWWRPATVSLGLLWFNYFSL